MKLNKKNIKEILEQIESYLLQKHDSINDKNTKVQIYDSYNDKSIYIKIRIT